MLSNPPTASNLHSRQRLHRRQNSTPTAFEAVKIAPLPNFRYHDQQQQRQQRSPVSHRRGLSLDTRKPQLQLPSSSATATTRQNYSTVSTKTTNSPGLSTTPQHVLRETQQQRTARLGPSQPLNTTTNSHSSTDSRSSCHSRNSSSNSINHFGLDGDNNFLISPHGTPQSQRFVNVMAPRGPMEDMSMPFDPYMSPISSMMKRSHSGYDSASGDDFELYAPNSALSTPTFMTFAEASPGESHQSWISEDEATNSHGRRTSRRISNGIMDRVAKFENMSPNTNPVQAERPFTPPGQNVNTYYPPTPMETPHDRVMKHHELRPSRFSDDYDESLEDTIKPVRNNRSAQRNSVIFQEMRQQAEALARSGHQRANTGSTADYLDVTSMDQFVKLEGDFEGLPNSNLGVTHELSRNAPPVHPHMAGFTMNGAFDEKPSLQVADGGSQDTVQPSKSSTQSSRRGSPHRRTESLASIVSAASISSINIEETKTDTGVTLEEISTFIEGPDADAKWTCTYEACGKKFGRKENIKSHVQTHLNDRQYQCPTCKKCFVRQHDLKRHAKIHTGIKPYPCECGNSFARHDALTRHRQRGMCIGAFDGIVRKVVKRGRPRKHRPDMDERLEKSERTRRKNKDSAGASQGGRATCTPSSASSQSGYSDSSAANSPLNENDFDGVLDDAPFTDMDMMDVGDMGVRPTTTALDLDHHNIGSTASRPASTSAMSPAGLAAISSAFMPTSGTFEHTDYGVTSVSPEQITATSPSAMSNYSYVGHGLPTLPTKIGRTSPGPSSTTTPVSPAKSVTSNYTHQPGTPPELSASSSPPATNPVARQPPRYFDIDDVDDFDPNSSTLSDHSIGLGTTAAAHAAAVSCGGGNMSGLSLVDVHDDMLLHAFGTHEDGLVQLHQAERDMMMGGGAKYFEDEDAVALFTNADDVDVFFGSS